MALGPELGWGAAVDVRGVRYARQGVLAAAIHHGQLRGQVEPIGSHADGTQRLLEWGRGVPAPYPGHYEPLVECGAPVAQGQEVGLLHDFHRIDEEAHPMRAEMQGFVMAQAWRAPVAQGQFVLLVGREIG